MTIEDTDCYNMSQIPLCLVEEPQIHYAEFVENVTLKSGQVDKAIEEPKQITPIRRKKKAIAEGGC